MAQEWANRLFNSSASKSTVRDFTKGGLPQGPNWDYITGANPGKRDMTVNYNLLNPDNFKAHWTKGPKKIGYTVYNNVDVDKDGLPDLVALDPTKHVVGINEKVIIPEDKSEKAYKRNYYALSNADRDKITYQEYLDTAQNIEGYKDLTKYKDNRSKQTWMLILNHINGALTDAKFTPRIKERLCKLILNSIAENIFFDGMADDDQKALIIKSPQFKKTLHSFISAQGMLAVVLPKTQANNIINGGYNLLIGAEDATYSKYEQFLQTITKYQLGEKETEAMYDSILSQKLTKKYMKDNNITPLHIAQHPELASNLSNYVAVAKKQLGVNRKKSTFESEGLGKNLGQFSYN